MSVVIIDTGCANLSSVKYALERLDYQPIISQNPNVILSASKLLLPGVGTAKAAMEQLHQRNLIALIKTSTQPILGICLGMQLLAERSEEGNVETLGIINESIIRIPDHGLPLPHMGWNCVDFKSDHPLFKGIESGAYFYFVHGFALPYCSATIAQTSYGTSFTAVLQKDNFFGVQFHPERSGSAGAQLLKNFLEM